MITEISAAVAVAKSISEAVGNLAAIDPKHREAVLGLRQLAIELQGKVFNVQSQFQELADAKRDAERKLAAMAAWELQAARYVLKELRPGIFVYALRPDAANGEPAHWVCPACSGQQKRFVLSKRNPELLNYSCPNCRYELVVEDQDVTAYFSSSDDGIQNLI